jgi:hypothetical protein
VVELQARKYVQKNFKKHLTVGGTSGIFIAHTVTKNTKHTDKMKTKTLLLAAAALAATVISSQAQVYSGVVGYVSTTLPANTLVLAANPLDNGTNDLNSLLAALPSKSQVQFWNGSGFTICNKTTSWSPDPTLPPGTGFFIKTPSSQTNTFVGAVDPLPGGGTTTNALTANVITLVGSQIPYATDLNDTNNTLNLLALPSKSQIQIWNGSGFTIVNKTTTWSPDQQIGVGQGFFIKAPSTTNWVQTLQ